MSAVGSTPRRSYARRLCSVRHAAFLAGVYAAFERLLLRSRPLLSRIGFGRLERSVAAVEGAVKGALFDCRMCGSCILSATGLSCPMNCPKQLRNGPCGGVRPDGHCEVIPAMPCVWVKAWEGSQRMATPARLEERQPPHDHRRWGRSSWLAVAARGAEPQA